MYQFMKKHRFLTLILSLLFIIAFSSSAFAYSASYISNRYDFYAGDMNLFARDHNVGSSSNYRAQWVATPSGGSDSTKIAISNEVQRFPNTCLITCTADYYVEYHTYQVYMRVRPVSGSITNISGYAETCSSNSCPYGAHA